MAAEQQLRTASVRSPARRIAGWLLRLLLVLVILVSAALVAVFAFERSTLQPLTEWLVERSTGRSLSIDGGLEVRAGRVIVVRAERIRLANADWGSSDDMLNVALARVEIDLARLLRGTALIDEVEISGAGLLFEENEQGLSNWVLATGKQQPPEQGEPEQATTPGLTALPVASSRLSDIAITIKSAALGQPLEIRLQSAGHGADADANLVANMTGTVQDRSLELQARIGPLAQLLAAGAVDFDGRVELEGGELGIEGQVDDLSQPQQVSLEASMLSADISRLFSTLGLEPIIAGAADVKASLQPADGQHRLDLAATVGSLTLDARARLESLTDIDGASIEASAGGPDLAAVALLAGLEGVPAQPFTLETALALSGQQLTIGETHFYSGDNHLVAEGTMSRFPELAGSNLSVQLSGKNYLEFAGLLGIEGAEELNPEAFELSADLDYSGQDRQQFNAKLAIADASGDFSGELTGDADFVGSRLEFRLGGRNDALLARLLGKPTQIEGRYELKGSADRRPEGYGIDSTTLSIGANRLQVDGVVGNDPLQGGTELSLSFQGPDPGKIAALAGYSGFMPAGEAEIKAALRAREQAIHVDDLSAKLGRNALQASGLVSLQQGIDGSRVKLALSGADIAEVLPPDLLAYVDPKQAFELNGTFAVADEQLAIEALQAKLGEVGLKGSGSVSLRQPLTATSLKIDAGGPDLAAIVPESLVPYTLPAANFSVAGGIALTADGLALDGVEAQIGDDRLQISGRIPLDTPTDGLDIAVAAKGPNLRAAIPPELRTLDFAELPYDISGGIKLAGGSLSLHQLNLALPRGHIGGEVQLSLADPLEFGQFDLDAKGTRLDEILPPIENFRPAAVAFELDARGRWNRESVSIEHGRLDLDDSRVEVQGDVNLQPGAVETRLTLLAQGDSLADFGQLQNLTLPDDDFRVEATLNGSAKGLEIPKLAAHLGDSDLRGSMRYEYADKPFIGVELESDQLDLSQLLAEQDSGAAPEATQQAASSDGRVIPQIPLQGERLNAINLETRIRIGELNFPNHTLQNIRIDTTLQNGELRVREFTATTAQGQLEADFRAVADGDRIVTGGTLEGNGIRFGKGGSADGEAQFPRQDIWLEFDTEGATVRELAANLDGYAKVTGGKGRMRNSYALGLFGSFFEELLSSVNPFITREPYTTISCFAAYAEINDGVAVINPGAVLQTDKLNMFARGQVDLNTEELNLRFDTSARKGLGISVANFVNPFVGVSGTLASPGIGLDPKNAMFEGGFAYATGGLSIVAKSLWGRWFAEKDPCAEFTKEAQEIYENRKKQQQQ